MRKVIQKVGTEKWESIVVPDNPQAFRTGVQEDCGEFWNSDLEVFECCKQSLLSDSPRILEDKNVKRNMSGGPTHERSKGCIQNGARGHLCDILAKNLAILCQCLEDLNKVKLK